MLDCVFWSNLDYYEKLPLTSNPTYFQPHSSLTIKTG